MNSADENLGAAEINISRQLDTVHMDVDEQNFVSKNCKRGEPQRKQDHYT